MRNPNLMVKHILHLCADTGSDTIAYQNDPNYRVHLIGKKIGIENFDLLEWCQKNGATPHGIIANPVCTEFSTARTSGKARMGAQGLKQIGHVLNIITQTTQIGGLNFFVIENPATGDLKKLLGTPTYIYQPWWYGSPWTKQTALWGNFNTPPRVYHKWENVPKQGLYVRPGRHKPSLAALHKNQIKQIPEFRNAGYNPQTDAEARSLCSTMFAEAFKQHNP